MSKVVKTKLFLSTCHKDPSATDLPLCYEAATNKINFLHYINATAVKHTNMPAQRNIFNATKTSQIRVNCLKIYCTLFECYEPER